MTDPYWRGERYRLYIVGVDGKPHGIAEATTPEGVGQAIVTIAEEARLVGEPAQHVGVLDWHNHRWLTSAWPTRNSTPF